MKILYAVLGVALLMINSTAFGQTFMTEDELMATFPGATVSGIANSDGKTKWVQTYGEPKKKKKKGKGKGDFGGDPYSFKWYVKKGKWCENWGEGRHCWEMEKVNGKKIQPYKKGKPLKHAWYLQ